MTYSDALAPIETILADAKAGKMFILIDDEDRENEGDLIISGEFADAEAINFMAKHGRGLICLAMQKEQIQQLGLPPMSQHNSSRHQTAFTVSIEAREGVTTGISAGDRAKTIADAIADGASSATIATPGHVFPLEAREGGVLVRAGHTEAAVDVSQLAGLNPSGVICEIMREDGEMARLPDLIPFAKEHGLNIATIADLIAYRRKSERLVERMLEVPFDSAYGGEFTMILYRTTLDYAEHIALVKGDVKQFATSNNSALVRMHSMDVLGDMLGDLGSTNQGTLQHAMSVIADQGSGAIVLIREPNKHTLSNKLRQKMGETIEQPAHLRRYGIGAQILADLGISNMTLLTNHPRPPVGLEGYGLSVAGYMPLNDTVEKEAKHG